MGAAWVDCALTSVLPLVAQTSTRAATTRHISADPVRTRLRDACPCCLKPQLSVIRVCAVTVPAVYPDATCPWLPAPMLLPNVSEQLTCAGSHSPYGSVLAVSMFSPSGHLCRRLVPVSSGTVRLPV